MIPLCISQASVYEKLVNAGAVRPHPLRRPRGLRQAAIAAARVAEIGRLHHQGDGRVPYFVFERLAPSSLLGN